MSKFKIGDWITIEGTLQGDKFKLTEKEIEYEEILLAHFRFSKNKWNHWKPQVGKLACWYNYFRSDNTIYHVGYLTQDILDSYDHIVPIEFIQTLRGENSV